MAILNIKNLKKLTSFILPKEQPRVPIHSSQLSVTFHRTIHFSVESGCAELESVRVKSYGELLPNMKLVSP